MAQRFGDLAPSGYPGERLGLPEQGPGSVARLGRRLLALAIDWGVAALPAYLLFGGTQPELWHLGMFAVMQLVFIPTLGGSLGHRLARLHLVALRGGWVGLWRPAVRTLLLLLVVPLLVWDSDQRAFHDKIVGTVLVRS